VFDTSTERPPLLDVLERASRRSKLLVAAALLVAVVIGVITVVLRTVDHEYGPIQRGNFGGLYSPASFLDSKTAGSYLLPNTPGATGQVIGSVANLGAHSVKITSIDTNEVVTDVRWSVYREGRTNIGADTPWQSFPAVIPAHGTIRLLTTIRRPTKCPATTTPGVGSFYSGSEIVHWESLLHDHTTTISDGPSITVQIC
jgi:hypothetical protein